MSPRPRKKGRRDLPPNLYTTVSRGRTYYVYEHPQTRKRHGMGVDKAKAIQAAKILNSRLMPTGREAETMAAAVLAGPDQIGTVLERFAATLPDRRNSQGNPMAAKTIHDYTNMLREAAGQFGHLDAHEVTRRHIAEHLNQYPPRSSNSRRNVLRQAFAWMVAEGLRDDNPVEGTATKTEVVQRQRLTLDEWRAIRDAGEPWFRNALDLALQTCQRRGDLVVMRFDHIEDGHLLVRQQKIAGKEAGNIRIAIGPELQRVIDACRDDVLSPFLIHRRPTRNRRDHQKRKEHWTQLVPERLSREFARVRDRLGIRSELPSRARPSLHEVRALGADLYRQAGWSEDAVQRLLGHSSQAMTKVYLSRHRETWVDAEAGLDVG